MSRLSFFILALLVLIVLRIAARGFFRKVGRTALARQPATIHLHHRLDHRWRSAGAVDALAQPLLALGFVDAGTFTIVEMPGLALRLLAQPDECAGATIYEHPKVGVWLDLFTRYQ